MTYDLPYINGLSLTFPISEFIQTFHDSNDCIVLLLLRLFPFFASSIVCGLYLESV